MVIQVLQTRICREESQFSSMLMDTGVLAVSFHCVGCYLSFLRIISILCLHVPVSMLACSYDYPHARSISSVGNNTYSQ